jgi:hypothetical protein
MPYFSKGLMENHNDSEESLLNKGIRRKLLFYCFILFVFSTCALD